MIKIQYLCSFSILFHVNIILQLCIGKMAPDRRSDVYIHGGVRTPIVSIMYDFDI